MLILVRAAELSNSLPTPVSNSTSFDSDPDSQMQDVEPPPSAATFPSANSDPNEARLESQELSRYLLAKSYFDCREYDRCAAVFIPSILPRGPLFPTSSNTKYRTPTKADKGKGKEEENSMNEDEPIPPSNALPKLSQKALFLALYAKYMSGEKKKDEDGEMIMGPADGGTTVNKELMGITTGLQGWFLERAAKGLEGSNQGWLEYLYGIVLAKGKTEIEAKKWFIKSVHLFPYNWGAWLELSELLNSVEEVGLMWQTSYCFQLIEIEKASKGGAKATAKPHDTHLPPICQPGTLPVLRSYPPSIDRT